MTPPHLSAAFADYDVATCQARIAMHNDRLNAVLFVVKDPVIKKTGALAGVPYVLKDTWDTANIPTTGGSWRHRARVPVSSCHAYRALSKAGAVLLGKSNLCDLAFSTESDNHMRGPVRNPFDGSLTAGGSTGGGAAAVADGMAAFDWGTDFGGSIRGPAAWCGVVGLRLSTAAWPVGFEHFPRIAPFFWNMCAMGPVTRTVAGARAVIDALASDLRKPIENTTTTTPITPTLNPNRVVIWSPDAPHREHWPTFIHDAQSALDHAGVTSMIAHDLPTPTAINALYTEYLAAHFDDFVEQGELPLAQGAPAVLLSVLSGGRLDRRVHPNTATLLLAVFALRLVHRDKARAQKKVQDARNQVNAIWDSGALIVSPTTTVRPPRHGRAAFATRSMSFCKLGNLVDATALSIPCGTFEKSTLPRSLQILGPPGSEKAVLDLGERLFSSIKSC